MKKIIFSVFTGYVVLALFMLPTPPITPAQASDSMVANYTLLEPLPCLNDGTQTCTDGKMITEVNFANYVRYAFNLIIALSAVSAVLVIVAGGFRYVTTDSFQGKNDGKKMIIEALKGLLLVLCSFLILRTIDPRLVDIPTTLVTPLKINYEKGLLQKYINGLSSSVEKQSSAQKLAAAEAENATKKLDPLDQRLKELLDVIENNPNSAEAQRAREELGAISNSSEYKDNYFTKVVSGARSVFRQSLVNLFNVANQSNSTKDVFAVNQQYKGTLNSITYNEERLLKEIPETTMSQGVKDGIKDEASYARGITHIYYINYALARDTVDRGDAKSIFDFQISSASEEISKIKNSALRQESVAELEKTRAAIKLKYPN